MCGIAGFIGFKKLRPAALENTLDRMKNRGPDGQQQVAYSDGSLSVNLLHSRLSIIDLDDRANQPFVIGDFTILFNGEIYNYLEVRKDLEKRGVKFSTNSDTEVLLQSFIELGPACLEQLEGMWSFVIYNRREQSLFLSRDRFGEKPLYYVRRPEGLYFGSEVKFLQSLLDERLDVNQRQVLRFVINGYKSLYKGSETFFTEVHEVPYATNLIVDRDLKVRQERYWRPAFNPHPMTHADAIEGFRHHLIRSVELRLRSDVPLAFCLSGGIDSSALTSIAAKIFKYDVHAFSIIDRDERYNELKNIQSTVADLGCKLTAITLEQEPDFRKLEKLVRYHDAPVATISYFIHSFLSESMHRQGYKVAFSGTAADELVTGYYDHYNLHLYEVRNQADYPKFVEQWERYISPVVRNPYLKQPDLYLKNPQERRHVYLNNDVFSELLHVDFSENFFEEKFTDSLLRNRMMNELFHEATPVVLHEDDLNSMFFSIENRSPFLDRRLFEFAYQIPNHLLIEEGYNKFVLREAMRGILNEKVRTDRQKKGFNASINSIIDFGNPNIRDYLLDDGPIYRLFDRNKFEKMIDPERKYLENSVSKFLFYFIGAKIFLDQQCE